LLRAWQSGAIDVRGEAELFEDADAVPVEVDLIPLEAVAG
jgi:hypothetical protein